jgi:hypothetical protein
MSPVVIIGDPVAVERRATVRFAEIIRRLDQSRAGGCRNGDQITFDEGPVAFELVAVEPGDRGDVEAEELAP